MFVLVLLDVAGGIAGFNRLVALPLSSVCCHVASGFTGSIVMVTVYSCSVPGPAGSPGSSGAGLLLSFSVASGFAGFNRHFLPTYRERGRVVSRIHCTPFTL